MTTLIDTVGIETQKRSLVESRPSEGWFEVGTRGGSPTQWDRLAGSRGHSLDGSGTTLTDAVRIDVPTSSPVRPTAPVDPPRDTATESRSRERWFEVESPGGHLRTVVGQLAYFDDEAQTYMVLTRSGVLVGVPLRDIKSSRGVPRGGSIIEDALSKLSSLRNTATLAFHLERPHNPVRHGQPSAARRGVGGRPVG